MDWTIRTIKNHELELRTKSTEIKDDILKTEIIEVLQDTLSSHPTGVGLSAPQIGYNYRIIAIQPPEEDVYVLINPEITEMFGQIVDVESCLSVPDVKGVVKRADNIKVIHDDGVDEIQGFEARIIQHEIDHLDGILFIDRAEYIE